MTNNETIVAIVTLNKVQILSNVLKKVDCLNC